MFSIICTVLDVQKCTFFKINLSDNSVNKLTFICLYQTINESFNLCNVINHEFYFRIRSISDPFETGLKNYVYFSLHYMNCRAHRIPTFTRKTIQRFKGQTSLKECKKSYQKRKYRFSGRLSHQITSRDAIVVCFKKKNTDYG